MTYQRSLGARINARRRPAMGDVIDDAVAELERRQSAECMTSANATVAALDAKTYDLAGNWHPTGFYSLDQIKSLVGYANQVLSQAVTTTTIGISAQPEGSGAIGPLKSLLSGVNRKLAEGAKYLAAANAAAAQGIQVIDSPGFKNWITFSMSAASSAISGLAYVECMKPWYVGALATIKVLLDKLWGAAKQIVGVAVDIGQAVLSVPEAVSDWLTIMKWVALLGGAYLVYEHRNDLMSLV